MFNNIIFATTGFEFKIIIIMLTHSFFQYIIGFNNSKQVAQNNYKKSMGISITHAITSTVLSLLMISLISDDKASGMIFGTAIPTIVIGLLILVYYFIKGKKIISFKYWKYALIIGLPVLPHLVSHLLISQFDRFIIKEFDEGNLGYYGLAITISGLIQLVISGINAAWVPWYFNNLKNENYNKIKYNTRVLTNIVLVGSILLIYIIPEILFVFAPSNYNVVVPIVSIFIASHFFQFLYTFYVDIQFYIKKRI